MAGLEGAAVVEGQVEVGAAVAERHRSTRRIGRAVSVRVGQIVDEDLRHLVRDGVDGLRLKVHRSVSVLGIDLIDDPLTKLERGALSRDVDDQALEFVVGVRKHLVVEKQHHACQDGTDSQEREKNPERSDTARGHSGNLVRGGKLAERVEYRYQDGHGESEGDGMRKRQEHELTDHGPGESLSEEVGHPHGERIQEQEPGESRECKKERSDMGAD